MLTCVLCYVPRKAKLIDQVKYTCLDNKIHIRFKDFNSPQTIKGFELKLTYLISYLFNYCYLPTVLRKDSNQTLLKNFLSNSDLNEVLRTIKVFITPTKTNGFKLGKNYNRKDNKFFGNVDINCFPLLEKDGVTEIGSLKQFLKTFGGIKLEDYLFNDGYEVVIKDINLEVKLNKYQKKDIKIQERNRNKTVDLVSLW